MSQDEARNYWISSSQEDWEVAEKLFASQKYNHALFFLQLALEKLIKAIHVSRKDDQPLYVHNLVLLAQKSGLELSGQVLEELKEISSFNVSARYDNYKRDFYQKATSKFTEEWLNKGGKIRNQLLEELNKP